MRQYFSTVYFFFLLVCFSACSDKINTDQLYQSLQDNQAKAIILIDDKAFYPSESVFSGDITALKTFFRFSIFDQFQSNIVIAFGGENWYVQKPMIKQVFIDNQVAASVMVGKIKDKAKALGEGYLMTEGTISVESFSKEKIVIRLRGKVGKYEHQREPTKWNRLEGAIVFRKPNINIQGLSEKDLF